MGGCFAQEENSSTVDTYWPTQRVLVSNGVQNSILAETSIFGGDSQHDELAVEMQASTFAVSHLIAGLRQRLESRAGLLVLQGWDSNFLLGQFNGNTSAWPAQLGEKYRWWTKNGHYERENKTEALETYSLDDSTERYFRLGGALAEHGRYYYNIAYYNSRTGNKAQWIPMLGMNGSAFFEPVTLTLTEQ